MEKYHVNVLRNEYSIRSKLNSSYSLRAFARDLSVSVSWLSEFLNGKKGISESKAKFIANKIKLNPKENELFIISSKASHSRSPEKKELALIEIQKSHFNINEYHKIQRKEQTVFGSWYSHAIIELFELDECEHTVSWISKKLNLSEKVVFNVLEELLDNNLIKLENNKYSAKYSSTQSTIDVPSSTIKNYHFEIIEKAKESLLTESVDEREFNSMTLSFDDTKLNEAKYFIRKFLYEFADKFYDKNSSKNSVFQFSSQFFRLDKKIN